MADSVVPADFPVRKVSSALSGAHPKMALIEVDGVYYRPGSTPAEIQADFERCEDLANQLMAYCRRKIADGTVPTAEAALERALDGLKNKPWCTAEQNIWIVRRTAALLGWPVPGSIPPLV
jgi:hypothetical protein